MNDDNFIGGLTTVLGALAYRSAKNTRLGLKEASAWRSRVEFTLLLVVCLPFVFSITETDGVVHRPWAALVIPIWTIIAYAVIRRKKIESTVTIR